MRSEIAKSVGDGATTLAVSSGVASELGWLSFLDAHAPGLGFISSVVFGTIGTIFYYLSHKQKNENADKIAELKLQKEANAKEIKELRDELTQLREK